ncbi:MAG: hypothetical protein WDM78_20110 [Puia sp.]
MIRKIIPGITDGHYDETWQYTTYLTSNFDFVHGTVIARLPDEQIHNCWKENDAATILLASTSQLSQDIVQHFPIEHRFQVNRKIVRVI